MHLQGIVCGSSPSSWSDSHWWIVLQPSCILCAACHGLSFVEDMLIYLSLVGGRMMDFVSMGNRGSVLRTRTIGATCAATHAALPTSNTSYVYVNEFFGGCPTNLSSTEATTWSHSERVAYVCFLSSGEDAADEHVHTTQLLGVSLIQTDVFNQSVFYHVLLLMRGPFSPGSHYRLKAK